METVLFEKTNELKRERLNLEKQLNVKIKLEGKSAIIEGEAVDEYEALIILEAIAFGFSTKKALKLKDEAMVFKKIRLRDYTRRKDMYDVRSRLIGTDGKIKHTIEELSGCEVVINGGSVGLIGTTEAVDETFQGIVNLIKGSKVANVYHYLEHINAIKKNKPDDLGLKIKKGSEE